LATASLQLTPITISELAVHIQNRTGLAVEYHMLRQRIGRADASGKLPASMVRASLPGQGRLVRKVYLEDLDTWCEWFRSNA
jgi:hypothetical protein